MVLVLYSTSTTCINLGGRIGNQPRFCYFASASGAATTRIGTAGEFQCTILRQYGVRDSELEHFCRCGWLHIIMQQRVAVGNETERHTILRSKVTSYYRLRQTTNVDNAPRIIAGCIEPAVTQGNVLVIKRLHIA